MKTSEITLETRVRFAKAMTLKAAEMKDWRIRSKRKRAMRDVAREWANEKGYFIGTVRELRERYGDLVKVYDTAPDNDVKYIWYCHTDNIFNNIEFAIA